MAHRGNAGKVNTTAATIAWIMLLALIFLVPLTFSAPSSQGIAFTADVFDTPKVWLLRVGSMIALAAWAIDLILHGGKVRFARSVALLFCALAVMFSASTYLSIEPMQSFLGKYRRYDGLWSFFIYGILLWLTMQYATSDVRRKQIMQVLCASSFFVAGYGLLQALGVELFAWGTALFEPNRSFSTYGNPNLLAGFLAFSVFTSLGLALSEEKKLLKGVYWIATLLNAAVAITAFSRSVWVASIFGLLIMGAFLYRFRIRLHSTDYGFAGFTIAVTSAFVIRSLFSSSKVMNFASRIVSIFDFDSGSAVTRFQIWHAAWRATLDRPLLGWGPDTFRMVFRWFQPTYYNRDAGYRSVADNVHNHPLQMAAGIGLIGAAILYVLQAWIIVSAAKYAWKTEGLKSDSQDHQASCIRYVAILAAVVTYVMHLLFGLSLPGTTFLLWIFFGALLAPLAQVREVAPLREGRAIAAIITALVIAFIPALFATQLLMADHAFAQGQVAWRSEDMETAIARLTSATHMSPRNDQYAMKRTEYMVEAASRQRVSFDEAVRTVDELVRQFPNEHDVYLISLWSYMAFSQVDQAYAEKARELARAAVEMYPQGLALRYTYAEILTDAGRIDEAIEQLEFCVQSDPNFKEAKKLLGSLREK